MAAVLAVPGFGPALCSDLMTWRANIERRFKFNPAQGVDPADINSIDREVARIRLQLEQELQNGAAQLHQISQQVIATREALRPTIEQALIAVAQAEADLRIL
jgi:DNA-binding helix-hairpin-helix protein with protein kinase domain